MEPWKPRREVVEVLFSDVIESMNPGDGFIYKGNLYPDQIIPFEKYKEVANSIDILGMKCLSMIEVDVAINNMIGAA